MAAVKRFLGVGVLATLFLLAPSIDLGAGPARDALWHVVRSCVANYSLTGFAFPCLAVDLSGGESKGWVVLRPPLGAPDTVLAPTLRITGVEDPRLQDPNAVNYFAAAWNARGFVAGGATPATGEAAVAVNPRVGRTQDQLHLHIGCLSPWVRLHLQQVAPKLSIGVWTRSDRVLAGSRETWLLRTGSLDAASVQPFQLASEIAADAQKIGGMLIALVTATVESRNEFFVIAARTVPEIGPHAEGVVRPRCERLARAELGR
jgi:CDP-diacylglycerol pyrophosphatase